MSVSNALFAALTLSAFYAFVAPSEVHPVQSAPCPTAPLRHCTLPLHELLPCRSSFLCLIPETAPPSAFGCVCPSSPQYVSSPTLPAISCAGKRIRCHKVDVITCDFTSPRFFSSLRTLRCVSLHRRFFAHRPNASSVGIPSALSTTSSTFWYCLSCRRIHGALL